MKVSFERVSQTIKKLPVGYYLGKEVEVDVLPSVQTSRFLVNKEKIEISYPQISSVLEKIKDESVYEKVVRSNFYHELSHAILTPRCFKNVTYPINVFEDERIERKLDGYFYGVDFKEQVSLINSPGGDSPNEKFFDLVRFRIGPREFLERVEKLLSDYDELTFTSSQWEVNYYVSDIEKLYQDYTGESLERSSDSKNSEDTNSLIKSLSNLSLRQSFQEGLDCHNGSEEFLENQEVTSSETVEEQGSGEEFLGPKGEAGHKFKEQVLKEFERVTTLYDNPKLMSELLSIFESAIKVHKANSSALNSYSGVFDPRSVVRKDCKYFLVKGRGDRQNYSKINLNLFVDRSGSMRDNVQVVNEIIHSLYKIEKLSSNFTFNLITLGYGERLEDKKDILYSAEGGNRLDSKLFEIYKKVQTPKAVNYNLVLFDGYTDGAENFEAFNSSNVIIISDTDNENEIRKYASSARKIFIKENYSEVFVDEMIKLLKTVVR